ncbi:hypothetical protein BpHYR1_002775 [Brachionus plicatilis]|uniref:Uncharacterized protein n=1 Tax=Brachionus plicatilis TaxID=10195 RepID=A0A3M7SZD4_BRAPC|nr:hypothetical protein BpHYR1_002775 [Brachionus plicatilis]
MSQNFDLGKILDSCCNKRKQNGDFFTTEKKKRSNCQLKINFENICFLEKCCKTEIKCIEEKYSVRIDFNSDKENSYISIEQSGSDTTLKSEIESEINDLIEQKIQKTFLCSPIPGSNYLVANQSFIKVIQDLENQNSAIVEYELNHEQDAWNYEKAEAEINSIIL